MMSEIAEKAVKAVVKDYGTNNSQAFEDDCEMGDKHEWAHARRLGNCYNKYTCVKCGAILCIDSSD